MIKSTGSLALLALLALGGQLGETRRMTVYNNCPFTIWPAIFTQDSAKGKPDGVAANGGWELGSYQVSHFNVPDNWEAGRIWARQACDFKKPDVESCYTGSCIGGLNCKFPGVPPATLAEFTLNQAGVDHYDVSLVDGLNLPMKISAPNCPTAGCFVDLNPQCPDPLRVRNSDGYTVACHSACKKLGGEHNCCSGSKSTPANCPKSGVQYYDYFKSRCPATYVYAYDESSGTALFTCGGGPTYTVTFCP